ncbi:MAG: hypothetical protein CM15mL3_0890 [Kanaloavirus sp.]|nr:MAG: hypothetical protein CM15mL3_0890 [Kanaloavirus sp.]
MDSAKLIDMVLDDAPAHEISDGIKDVLYAKTASRVETERPLAVADLFNDESESEVEEEPVAQEEEPTDGE